MLSALRSIGAVVAGVIVVIVLSNLVDVIMHATGIIPDGPMWNPWYNALALAYRCVIAVGAGWVTARIAARSPVGHAVALGIVGTALGLLGVVLTWNLNYGPHWYPIALAVTALPCCWLGGRIAAGR